MNDMVRTEQEEGAMEVLAPSALEALNKGEISIQIATAKQYPRSITQFRKEVFDLAALDQETAMSCFYKLKRKEAGGGTKIIEGPSARFAEIVAYAWGNCRSGARVVSEGDHFISAQGFFADLERNVAITMEVQRRISGKEGRKYSPDMIAVTGNAACAIAHRNAVFKVVPKAVWKPMYDKVMNVAKGDASTLAQRRVELFQKLKENGISMERACSAAGVAGPQDIGVDELFDLAGSLQAVLDGDQSATEAFPAVNAQDDQPTGEIKGATARERAAEAAKAAGGDKGGAQK